MEVRALGLVEIACGSGWAEVCSDKSEEAMLDPQADCFDQAPLDRSDAPLLLDSEALSFAVDVAQTQVNVCADTLHGLNGQGASQVLCVGSGGRETKAKAVGWHRGTA